MVKLWWKGEEDRVMGVWAVGDVWFGCGGGEGARPHGDECWGCT